MKRLLLISALVLSPLALSATAQAQGTIRGAERGVEDGNRAAGPVGGVVGGVLGKRCSVRRPMLRGESSAEESVRLIDFGEPVGVKV